MTTKVCIKCKIEKSIDCFQFRKDTNNYRGECLECQSLRARKRYEKYGHTLEHKTLARNRYLKYEYGITLEEYNAMFALQEGCCAICDRHQTELTKILSVDHCHTTNKVRELLCDQCNTSIGLMQEDTETLQNAINYLKKHQNLI